MILVGGVISSLYPENGNTVKGTTPSLTKKSPYKMTCEEVDDNEEVYPSEFSSGLHSENKEKPQISIVDHYSSNKEGTEITEPEPKPCLEQFTSDLPKEDSQPLSSIPPSHKPETVAVQGWFHQPDEASSTEEELPDDEPTLLEWESKSTASDEEASLALEEEVLNDNYEMTLLE